MNTGRSPAERHAKRPNSRQRACLRSKQRFPENPTRLCGGKCKATLLKLDKEVTCGVNGPPRRRGIVATHDAPSGRIADGYQQLCTRGAPIGSHFPVRLGFTMRQISFLRARFTPNREVSLTEPVLAL